MKWRLYYGDGTTFDGESDDDAFKVPATGIILAKQDAENWRGYSIRRGTYFCWERICLSDGTVLDDGRWGAKDDLFGLMDYYSTHRGPQKVLIGREIHDDVFIAISRVASGDGCLCIKPCDHVKPENY